MVSYHSWYITLKTIICLLYDKYNPFLQTPVHLWRTVECVLWEQTTKMYNNCTSTFTVELELPRMWSFYGNFVSGCWVRWDGTERGRNCLRSEKFEDTVVQFRFVDLQAIFSVYLWRSFPPYTCIFVTQLLSSLLSVCPNHPQVTHYVEPEPQRSKPSNTKLHIHVNTLTPVWMYLLTFSVMTQSQYQYNIIQYFLSKMCSKAFPLGARKVFSMMPAEAAALGISSTHLYFQQLRWFLLLFQHWLHFPSRKNTFQGNFSEVLPFPFFFGSMWLPRHTAHL